MKGYRKWTFFLVVVGLNPITIYVAGFLVKFGDVARFLTEHLILEMLSQQFLL